MDQDAAERLAGLLIEARREVRQIETPPEALAPATVADGYAVQEAWTRLVGEPVAGWKIGATAAALQQRLKVDGPFAGRSFPSLIHASPATLGAAGLVEPHLEAEFAFRLGRDLDAEAAPFTAETVAAAVAELIPAIEVVEPHFARWRELPGSFLIADDGGHGRLILGPPTRAWREIDLAAHAVILSIDGKEVVRGSGDAVLGHPLNALAWLANERAAHGAGLAAGEVVSTGTCTGLLPAPAGAAVSADFGRLGVVTLVLAP